MRARIRSKRHIATTTRGWRGSRPSTTRPICSRLIRILSRVRERDVAQYERTTTMTAQAHNTATPKIASLSLGASTVALAGVGLSAYGIMFLIRNFNGFIELGITPALIGTTAEE